MISKASIKGHPIHPILICFPVAFFVGTFVFDILHQVKTNPVYFELAYYLEIAGIITGLIAAIPGIIDYFGTVPPNSSAKKRATMHALLNVSMIAVFYIAWYVRRRVDTSGYVILSFEAIGIILICIAGWMGGTLVYRNQIGVYNRYADAGKWKEEHFGTVTGRVKVAAAADLKNDQMKLVHINNKRIVIAKTEDRYVAFEDHCSHKGGSLAGGSMICGTVQCPWHGSQFDVTTGRVKAGPAKDKIATYDVVEDNGEIYLLL